MIFIIIAYILYVLIMIEYNNIILLLFPFLKLDIIYYILQFIITNRNQYRYFIERL